jgi:uncharacterized protein (TIGR03118 family)
MWFGSRLFNLLNAPRVGTPPRSAGRRPSRRRPPVRLLLEVLEDRLVPSTLNVTSATDDGSAGTLRAVIAAAQSGDTVTFDSSLAGQTIALTGGELVISKSLDIDGPGADQLTISGNHASRVFDISGSTTDVEISGLSLADGLANSTTAVSPAGNVTMGGAILNTGAQLTLSHVALADNQANATRIGYVQTNLVSDIPGLAQVTDANLKDPWGLAASGSGPFSVADQNASVATAYSVTAAGVSALPAQTVAIPITPFGKGQGPSGQVFNETNSFLVNGTPATFIDAGLNGAIYAWNSSLGSTAQIEAATTGALYSGLDIESTASGDFLYAADPKQNRVDVFNGSFQPVSLGAGAFVDPQLPAGLAPFNVEGIHRDIYVAYAPAGPTHYVPPEGVGAVAVFDPSGHFINQLISGGKLASPWGMVMAPSTFGQFGGDLLVGNFSYVAPAINAFDPVSGAYLGTVADASGNTLLNNGQGIWDMSFGNGASGGLPNTLYVSTGLNAPAGVNAVQGNDGSDGLFVAIDPLPEIAQGGAVANVSGGTLTLSHDVLADNRALGAADGSAQGGGVFNQGSTLAVEHSSFTDNQAIGGNGGPGRPGGVAFGGGIANTAEDNLNATLTVIHTTFAANWATGGQGGNGAAGGDGRGGGIANVGIASLTVSHSVFVGNQAVGGAGGDAAIAGSPGGTGGAGQGGALENADGSTGTVSDSVFVLNTATGGAGGLGGNGGNALGGGLFNDATASITLYGSTIVNNDAVGGAAGNGGSDGLGVGGGLYLTPGGVACADRWTIIVGNHAFTSDDDVFGDLSVC